MARINLLPWRDELRKEQKQNFLIALVIAIAIAGVLMAGVHFYFEDRITYQDQRNAYLDKEIKKLDQKIKEIRTLENTKKKLQARLDIIQQLQSSRPEIVHLFDELVRTLPDGVYLTGVTQAGGQINLRGIAQSNGRVSNYMWNLEKSDWLTNPVLNVINSVVKENTRQSSFTLKVTQTRKKKNDAEKK
jgi:type IV pilus assembly protein PilN